MAMVSGLAASLQLDWRRKKKKKKKEEEKEKEECVPGRTVGGDSGDCLAPCWRRAPCAPKRRLREGASPPFRRGAGGWRRAAPSLGAPFRTMLTTDVGDQRIQIDKFFMVLTLIGLRPDLETVDDQILGSSSVPSLDDVFARLLRISSTQTFPSDNTSDSSVLVSQTNSRGGHSVTMGGLPALPTWPSHLILSRLSLPIPPHLRIFSSLIVSMMTISAIRPPSQLLLPRLDRSTGKTIGIGHESQGLYHLTSPSTPAVCISTDAPLLIQSRLGHPSLSKFQKMVPSFSSLSSLACESCQLGKHTCVSFPKRLNNWAKSPFELAHTDVWGLFRTASTLGFQYFVTFIDDYSRLTMPRNIFLHHLLHLCPNMGSFISLLVLILLNKMGLLNVRIDILLRQLIPHSLLFPDQPLYFLPPRVFCCTCFVHNLTPGQDKLSARATKCIFLGYSRLQKGYCCYLSKTHRYFLSADVTFFEDSPFFSTSESLPISEVLPLPIISPPNAVPSRPLQVYHHVVVPPSLAEVLADSLLIPSASSAPALPPFADLPIALQKGWRQAMVDEMAALHSNGTWDLVVLPSGKSTVGCRWVYTVKVGPDGQVDRLKARLVAKGYTQVYGSDYGDTFSPVAKIASVRLLLFMAAMRGVWFSVQTTSFSIWLKHLLRELRFGKDEQMKPICDNQAALHIASNPVFHERTKHIEVDCHFIREKIASGCVATSFVNSNDQLAYIFTKSLRGPRIKYICNKLGAYDIYAPA
ncbi:putative mitochondrial protein [Vitis vinifera]|uniref:Putative mitochondrial protein n=1 Tax=Vitis vinifera TaxID=29760 RepID=A0A438DMU2_VITVI|nr:putative mitochondrial protein [Vitis vinifera]